MSDLTPRQIVSELDRHIIGQDMAKRAVAVAVRNRWRRRQLDPDFAREVVPRNIVMVGPTGVGKTEIARRLARLVKAPFVKVEASKFTEVGYVGRDVESMVRDLLEIGISMVRSEHARSVRESAQVAVEERLVSLLLGDENDESTGGDDDSHEFVRTRMREKLAEGALDEREIEVNVRDNRPTPSINMVGMDQMDTGMSSLLENLVPERRSRRRVTVERARTLLLEEETEKLLDQQKIIEQAIERTENAGMIFIDEIDKIASSDRQGNADVSRQGVQRDLLPIVEGSAINTKHGVVHSDQILFIAAGAFHGASVSDLMPELQGRFPIRVELDALTREDFRRILTEPDAAITKQQCALLGTESLEIRFTDDSLDALAELAAQANAELENIGARRLMTVMEKVFEEIAFDAPDMADRGETGVEITESFVRERLAPLLKDEDLGRFVL
ncbi:MAG: ATP-dependent protease ATPase subunit HslU [Phycisphaerales bacterium]|nr:ATP-dependent protease ATPase subunit HslU [Phycisphaerales bacterium]